MKKNEISTLFGTRNKTAQMVIDALPKEASKRDYIRHAINTPIRGAWQINIDGTLVGNYDGNLLYNSPRVLDVVYENPARKRKITKRVKRNYSRRHVRGRKNPCKCKMIIRNPAKRRKHSRRRR